MSRQDFQRSRGLAEEANKQQTKPIPIRIFRIAPSLSSAPARRPASFFS
jgi:hypothetical protein